MREFFIYAYTDSKLFDLRDTYKQEPLTSGLTKKDLDKYRKQIKFTVSNGKTYFVPYIRAGLDLREEKLCMVFNEDGSDNLYHKFYEKEFESIQNKDIESRFYDRYVSPKEHYTDSELVFKDDLSGDIVVSGEINDKHKIIIPMNSHIKSINIPDFSGIVNLQLNTFDDTDEEIKIKNLIINCPKSNIEISGYEYTLYIKELTCVGIDQRDYSESIIIDNFILNKDNKCLKQDLEILAEDSKIKHLFIKTDNLIDFYCSRNIVIAKIEGDSNLLVGSDYHKKSINMLDGKTFVITGSTYTSRPKLISYIEEAGGRVKGSINSSVDYLICDSEDSTSTKHREAIRNNVKIIPSTLVRFWLDECIIHR